MTKMNHERRNLYQRARASVYEYPAQVQRNTPYRDFWLPIGFGWFRHLTVPELIFVSPGCFYWLHEKDLYGKLKQQMDIVALRAAHILPPANRRNCEFCLITDDVGELENISLVGKRRTKQADKDGHFLCPHLDLAVFQQFSSKTHAAKAIIRFLKEIYYGDPEAEMTDSKCQTFFDDERHFDIGCGDDHSRRD